MKGSYVVLVAAVVTGLAVAGADAQSLRDRLRSRVQERVDDKADKAMDKALDKAENAISCKVSDNACIAKAQEKGQPVVVTDDKGKPLDEAAQTRAKANALPKPGEGAWANFDFVPGERVIFAEDFSKDRVGNFPRRMELLSGTMEVVDWQGKQWLRVSSDGVLKIPLPEVLPQRFTVEFDLPLPWARIFVYGTEERYKTTYVSISGLETGVFWEGGDRSSLLDPRKVIDGLGDDYWDSFLARTARFRLHVDRKYVKAYINEHRVANVPNADFGRSNYLVMEFTDNTNAGTYPYSHLITNISINAGGREMYDALLADGRVATQGIYFDTGSDVIRPESSGTLSEIADMLKAHGDLALIIEGHTDNVGTAAANQTLSEKRAAAVKTALVSKYGIAAARLDTKGLGQSKPAASNDTAEGRQTNRRVELVKK